MTWNPILALNIIKGSRLSIIFCNHSKIPVTCILQCRQKSMNYPRSLIAKCSKLTFWMCVSISLLHTEEKNRISKKKSLRLDIDLIELILLSRFETVGLMKRSNGLLILLILRWHSLG